MMRWLDKLMGLDDIKHEPIRPQIDYASLVQSMTKDKVQKVASSAVKSVGELIEEQTITDKELAKAQGLVKEDHPELSVKIGELRQVLENMRNAD